MEIGDLRRTRDDDLCRGVDGDLRCRRRTGEGDLRCIVGGDLRRNDDGDLRRKGTGDLRSIGEGDL